MEFYISPPVFPSSLCHACKNIDVNKQICFPVVKVTYTYRWQKIWKTNQPKLNQTNERINYKICQPKAATLNNLAWRTGNNSVDPGKKKQQL